jgi:hypothetical protein
MLRLDGVCRQHLQIDFLIAHDSFRRIEKLATDQEASLED